MAGQTAEMIDQEVHRLISSAYQDAKQILIDRKSELTALKDALIKYETVDGEDVKRILAGQVLSKPTVSDLLASERIHTGLASESLLEALLAAGSGSTSPHELPLEEADRQMLARVGDCLGDHAASLAPAKP